MKYHNDPTIPCTSEGCEKVFRTDEMLKIHFNTCHQKKFGTFVCSYPGCPKVVKTLVQLNNHIRYHHLSTYKHPCPKCDTGELLIIMIIYGIYYCLFSHLVFTAPFDLKDHMNKHLGIVFICDGCGNRYNTKKVLKQHYTNKHIITNKPKVVYKRTRKSKVFNKLLK